MTDAESIAVHLRAFEALGQSAIYGEAARSLLGEAERYWGSGSHTGP
ncbi:hypothetical protein [Streptacidiphilus sp. PAMC 29251]